MEAWLSGWPDFAQPYADFVIANARRVLVFAGGMWKNPSTPFFWAFLLAFLGWAALAFRRNYGGGGVRDFLRFCFPKEVYLHRSSATDVQVFLMNQFLLLPLHVLRGFGAPLVATLILGLDIGGEVPGFPLGVVESLAFLLVWRTAAELGYYIGHRASHQIPLLWEFHKVHHSAEVLTPLTLYRKHPVFDMVLAICVAGIRGVLLAAIVSLFGGGFHPVHLLGLNVYMLVYRLAGQNLRHSHIWWAWGPRTSHILMSPAQHQVHHSYHPRHIDKNFGEVLALWDWVFGTLYVAGEKEDLKFGLGYEHGMTNGVAAYLVPFRNAARLIGSGIRRLAPGHR